MSRKEIWWARWRFGAQNGYSVRRTEAEQRGRTTQSCLVCVCVYVGKSIRLRGAAAAVGKYCFGLRSAHNGPAGVALRLRIYVHRRTCKLSSVASSRCCLARIIFIDSRLTCSDQTRVRSQTAFRLASFGLELCSCFPGDCGTAKLCTTSAHCTTGTRPVHVKPQAEIAAEQLSQSQHKRLRAKWRETISARAKKIEIGPLGLRSVEITAIPHLKRLRHLALLQGVRRQALIWVRRLCQTVDWGKNSLECVRSSNCAGRAAQSHCVPSFTCDRLVQVTV